MLPLGLEFAGAGILIGAVFASGNGWLLFPALLCWPAAPIFTLIYLAINSDTSGASAPIAGAAPPLPHVRTR